MNKSDLENMYHTVLNKSRELFNPSESVFLETKRKIFSNSLPHIESILKAYDFDEQLTEFNKWIDQNKYNISYYEKLRSNSNFTKQWIDDNVFFCHVYKSIYSELKKSLQLKPEKKKADKKSYVWQNNPDKELPELYSLMINKYKLIAPDTTPEQFKAVFKGQPIESIDPIRWHQDNASELLYFIVRLQQSNNIEHNPKRADYQKLKACFVKPDGSPFNEALKTLKQQIEFIAPDKQKAIDDLVSDF